MGYCFSKQKRENTNDEYLYDDFYQTSEKHKPYHFKAYVKDNYFVYYDGHKVNDAMTLTFQDLGCGYGKDCFNAFFIGKRIAKANVSTFVIDTFRPHGYALDAYGQYFQGIREVSK